MENIKEPQNNFTEEQNSQIFSQKDSKFGPMIGSIIIIIIILVGGLYFLSVNIEEKKSAITNEEQQVVEETTKIEAEIDNLNFEEIENDLDQIEAEFDSL